MPTAAIVFVPFALFVPLFVFVSVAVWSDHRTRERASFYRSEVFKKVVDSTAPHALQMIELLREEGRAADRRRREGLRLGGLVVALVGVGLVVMLSIMAPTRPAWAVGFIPLLVGVAILVHSYVLAPRSLRNEAEKQDGLREPL